MKKSRVPVIVLTQPFFRYMLNQISWSDVKTKFIIILTVISLLSTAEATLIGLSWQTQLDTLPGMENELPAGVTNGETISGMFLYETDWGWVTGSSNDDSTRNYYTYSWSMQLGDNNYSRVHDDEFSILGKGSLKINNNHPQYYDRLRFGVSVTYSNPVNEYYFRLTLQDLDSTTFPTGDEPEVFNFNDFEVTNLEIRKIKDASIVNIAEYDNLSSYNLTVIPEPATLLLLGLGGLMLRRKCKA